MKIQGDWLANEPGDLIVVERVKNPPTPKRKIIPSMILVHYGVTSSLPGLVAAQRAPRPDAPEGYWAHLSIDGKWLDPDTLTRQELRVVQALPFTARGSHAGVSSFKGVASCNDFAIGVEIANPGPLVRNSRGELTTTYGQLWPESDAIEVRHRNPNCAFTHWARYSDQELDTLIAVCLLLRETYPSITHIAGHEDVAPGRKIDPGPAMDLNYIRRETRFL